MNPKVFISYSWTSPAHQTWVLQLATELRQSGVDVVLDKWDLKEGHDAHAFMEQMVTDPTVERVIMICDRTYTEKADGRSGGVGAEAQIITPELYGKQKQDKFVAIITERDDQGNPYVPTFFKSRVYIDMGDEKAYSEGFEQLLRWIFGKPLHVKPELGVTPDFLAGEAGRPNLPTEAKFRRARDLLRNGQSHAVAAAAEYFSTLAESLEIFRIKGADFTPDTFDDAVVKSIDEFLPYRTQCVALFTLLATHAPEDEAVEAVHRFLERLIPYMERPQGVTSWHDWNFDNFRFIVHELFLYAVAILIKNSKFLALARFLETEYYVRTGPGAGKMQAFSVFIGELSSLTRRGQRLRLNRSSVHADMLEERCRDRSVEFRELMQADFVIFLRAALTGERWYPVTSALMGFTAGPFEIFARAKSKRYFGRIAPIFGTPDIGEFRNAIRSLAADPQRLPRAGYFALPVAEAAGIDQVGRVA